MKTIQNLESCEDPYRIWSHVKTHTEFGSSHLPLIGYKRTDKQTDRPAKYRIPAGAPIGVPGPPAEAVTGRNELVGGWKPCSPGV